MREGEGWGEESLKKFNLGPYRAKIFPLVLVRGSATLLTA